jgi:hypothetical protein
LAVRRAPCTRFPGRGRVGVDGIELWRGLYLRAALAPRFGIITDAAANEETMGRPIRHVLTWLLAFVALFFTGLGAIALCKWAGLGDIAMMLVTVPIATTAGVLVMLVLLPRAY